MHIPDGLLTDPVCAATAALSATALGFGVVQLGANSNCRSRDMGLVASVIFAAQLINFPVDHGISGHVLGATFAVSLLGPWVAMWTMATVLLVQCALLGDGGQAALGANLLNMAVIAPLAAWCVMSLGNRASSNNTVRTMCIAVGAFCSVLGAAMACSLELAVSGRSPAPIVTAMLGAHVMAAIAEGCLTVAAIVLAIRLSLVAAPIKCGENGTSRKSLQMVGLVAVMLVALFVAPWASASPDGLETAVRQLGFSSGESAAAAVSTSDPFGTFGPAASTAVAGALGVLVVYGLSLALERAIARRLVPVRVRRR